MCDEPKRSDLTSILRTIESNELGSIAEHLKLRHALLASDHHSAICSLKLDSIHSVLVGVDSCTVDIIPWERVAAADLVWPFSNGRAGLTEFDPILILFISQNEFKGKQVTILIITLVVAVQAHVFIDFGRELGFIRKRVGALSAAKADLCNTGLGNCLSL